MMHYPEDGSLAEITASVPAVNPANVIIIQRSDEVSESDEPKCLFATFDRTKEGVEWPGDQFLEKLTPDLPKMKVPKVNKPEVTTKTYTQRRDHLRKKYKQRPPQRENHFESRRPRPPYKSRTNHHNRPPDHNHHHTRPDHNRHHKRPDHNHHQKRPDHNHQNRPENSHDIDPWIKPQPWLQAGVNSALGISTQISHVSHNNVYAQNSDSSHLFASSTISNNCNFPVASSDISFINKHVKNPSRPPTTNRMSGGPSFQPERFLNQHSVHPERGFFCPGTGPTLNRESDGSNNMPGLLGEAPGARYKAKPPLLGDYPLPNMHFNKNSASLSNRMFVHADPETNSAALLPRNKKKLDDQNSFVSSTKNSSLEKVSYDAGYGRIPRNNFNQYDGDSEISGLKSHDSASAVNHYEDQYRDSYNHLDGKFQNNKNIRSLENSSGSYKANFGRFKRGGVRRFKSGHREVGNDNLRENSYNKGQVSNMSNTFMNNQSRNAMEEPIIHISDSAVVYNQEDFPSDGYSATASNSTPNSVSRSNIRPNIHTKKTQGTTNKFTNNRQNRIKYNQGQRRGNWRTSRK